MTVALFPTRQLAQGIAEFDGIAVADAFDRTLILYITGNRRGCELTGVFPHNRIVQVLRHLPLAYGKCVQRLHLIAVAQTVHPTDLAQRYRCYQQGRVILEHSFYILNLPKGIELLFSSAAIRYSLHLLARPIGIVPPSCKHIATPRRTGKRNVLFTRVEIDVSLILCASVQLIDNFVYVIIILALVQKDRAIGSDRGIRTGFSGEFWKTGGIEKGKHRQNKSSHHDYCTNKTALESFTHFHFPPYGFPASPLLLFLIASGKIQHALTAVCLMRAREADSRMGKFRAHDILPVAPALHAVINQERDDYFPGRL